MRNLQAWFDGACEPENPGGHASYGFVVKHEIDESIGYHEEHGYLGHGPEMSNNVAEYAGIVAVLEYLAKLTGPWEAAIHGDSQFAIRQLTGWYRINGGLYLPYFERVVDLLTTITGLKYAWCLQGYLVHVAEEPLHKINFIWIPRELNQHADDLSKQALAEHGIRPANRSRNKQNLRIL